MLPGLLVFFFLANLPTHSPSTFPGQRGGPPFDRRRQHAPQSYHFALDNKPKLFRIYNMNQEELQKFTSWLGKRSYVVRVKRLGIERIREIARENGKKGGRPPKKGEVK
jgi:hypothetical protein